MGWFSCWPRMFVRGPVQCTSGTSWSQEWSLWSTTTQTTPRNVATGTMLRSRGRGRHAPCERSTARLSLGKGFVACYSLLVAFCGSTQSRKNPHKSNICSTCCSDRWSASCGPIFIYISKFVLVFGCHSSRWVDTNFLPWYQRGWQNMLLCTGNILTSCCVHLSVDLNLLYTWRNKGTFVSLLCIFPYFL